MTIARRQYVLDDVFVGRIQIVRPHVLWINAAIIWAYVLVALFWLILWGSFDTWQLFAMLLTGITSFYTDRHSITPVAALEKDRQGARATLDIVTRVDGTLTVTVHTDMVDYLLGALTADRARRFRPHWEVPAHLAEPTMRRCAWISAAGAAVAVSLVAALFVRYFLS